MRESRLFYRDQEGENSNAVVTEARRKFYIGLNVVRAT